MIVSQQSYYTISLANKILYKLDTYLPNPTPSVIRINKKRISHQVLYLTTRRILHILKERRMNNITDERQKVENIKWKVERDGSRDTIKSTQNDSK